MKSRSRKLAVKAADRAFSKYIVARDKKCVCCGKTTNLQCGHLFSRVAYSTRWSPLNAACQCAGCNLSHEYDPAPLTLWYIKKYGQDSYEQLHAMYRQPIKLQTYHIEEYAKFFEKRLKEIACL